MSVRADTGETGLPGLATAACLLVALAAFFTVTGAFRPTDLPFYAESARQIIGMGLMLTLIPPYIIVSASIGQRRSIALAEELRPRLPDTSQADAAISAMRGALRKTWRWGVVVGLVMGLLNTQPLTAIRRENPVVEGALSFGQLNMWAVIGMLMGVRFTAAREFRRLAAVVKLDLLRPDQLKAISRAGVVDVVIIAGALLLTPLQSLDAEFRWYNYQFGLLVALPAVTFFLIWPLLPLHRRNQKDRDARLTEVDRQLAELAPATPANAEASTHLETLLAHRARLRSARTWPLSTGLLSRVVLYLVIPPLAWAGAAVVERVVDAFLAG